MGQQCGILDNVRKYDPAIPRKGMTRKLVKLKMYKENKKLLFIL